MAFIAGSVRERREVEEEKERGVKKGGGYANRSAVVFLIGSVCNKQ